MILQFEDVVIDTVNFRLLKNKIPIAIEPQVFDLIVFLINNRDRLVSRKEIFEHIWSDREVSDSVLSNLIKLARNVLGDDGKRQKIIKTVHGRGYQFVSEIDESESINQDIKAAVSISSFFLYTIKNTKLITFSALLFVCCFLIYSFIEHKPFFNDNQQPNTLNNNLIRKSIAILPFENHSEKDSDIFFTNGIHDDLLTQISKIQEIKTISRISVMPYFNSNKKIKTIGDELNVSTLLKGGVQRSGNTIRINVQLINTQTSELIWAESYTRELKVENIFSIQSEITKIIASELKTALSHQEQQNIERLPTQNYAALEAYFHAKTSSRKQTKAGFQEAIKYLQKAIDIDPNFAKAYAELASFYLEQISWANAPTEQQIEKAWPMINTAMKLDNNMSETYRALGILHAFERNFPLAIKAFKNSITLNSNNTQAYISYAEFHLLDYINIPEAISLLMIAKKLNPKDDNLSHTLAKAYVKAERYNDAKIIWNEIISRKPQYSAAYRGLSDIAFYGTYQLAESIRILRKVVEIDPSAPTSSKLIGLTYYHTGDKEKAIQWLTNSLKLSPNSVHSEHTKAYIHMINGEYNKAFNTYIKLTTQINRYSRAMFNLMKMALLTNRSQEALNHFKKLYPQLFNTDASVDPNNFITAFALARLLKEKGEQMQANYLMTQCLKVLPTVKKQGWFVKYNNWEARIQLALGNKKAALAEYIKIAKKGLHSDILISDRDYQALSDEPKYQQMITIMQQQLKSERKMLRQMEANGELDIPPQGNIHKKTYVL